MSNYRYIKLTEEEQKMLSSAYKIHTKHHYREKCQSLLLSCQGYSIPEIAIMFNKHCDTIRSWFNLWEQEGISGFAIKSGRGVKPKLDRNNSELLDFIKKS
jgi:transposase